jgi:hypothetical protein
MPSVALGTFFSIPFTMPRSVDPTNIGHIQILICRQSNLDFWSCQKLRSVSVPEKEVIYLPPSEGGTNYLRSVGNDLWYIDIPKQYIRGITSVGGGDTGNPGFPAGGTDKEGETFTIQIRFGDSALPTSVLDFAAWKITQITESLFGEWSNTQRMFVYALPPSATIANLFNVTLINDPVAKISWSYTPVSIDPLSQVRISYSWSTPDNLGNTFRSKNVSFESHDGRGASAAGVIELEVMRFADMTISIQFLTINNTSYTWVATKPNIFIFTQLPDAQGAINRFPIIGEELEDGVIAMSFKWTWVDINRPSPLLPIIQSYYRIYRVDIATLETVLLSTINRKSGVPTVAVTIKDYSVEMGAEYVYFANAYQDNGTYISTLIWQAGGPLTPPGWNPPNYPGYARQMNFQGNIFLTTKWQQLRLQGNVTVGNFQRNTSDQFTATIGGKYPFYTRSAQFNYRTMSLGATISLNFDSTNTFLRFKSKIANSEMEAQMNAAAQRYQTDIANYPKDKYYSQKVIDRQIQYYDEIVKIYEGINPLTGQFFITDGTKPLWMGGQLYLKQNQDIEKIILRSTELFSESEVSNSIKRIRSKSIPTNEELIRISESESADFLRGPTSRFAMRLARDATEVRYSERIDDLIYAERKFREAVMEWLSDGQPKLLRSETEGNMICMISGASFTPLDKSRHIYSLNATMTEIAEYNLYNLILYGLVPIEFVSFYVPTDTQFGFIQGNLDTGI